MPAGRPKVKHEIIIETLNLISSGLSIRQSCKKTGMDYSTFHEKMALPEYTDQYVRAMEKRADAIFDEIQTIADGSGREDTNVKVNRDRLRVDARKWIIAKMMPKKYGDKTSQEIDDTAAALATIINQALGKHD